MLIYSSDQHSLNAPCSIFITLSGIFVFSRLWHAAKAFIPIYLTPCGITIDCKELQSVNALFPIFSKPIGKVIDFSFLHPLNAPSAMTLHRLFTVYVVISLGAVINLLQSLVYSTK